MEDKLTPEAYARYVEKYHSPHIKARLRAHNMERKQLDSKWGAALDRV